MIRSGPRWPARSIFLIPPSHHHPSPPTDQPHQTPTDDEHVAGRHPPLRLVPHDVQLPAVEPLVDLRLPPRVARRHLAAAAAPVRRHYCGAWLVWLGWGWGWGDGFSLVIEPKG